MESDVKMMYAGEKPWHGIGKELDNPPTFKEAIINAGMDWGVEIRKIKTDPGDIFLPGKFAVIRKDNEATLGIVGSKRKFIQNTDSFGFFDKLIEKKNATYHTAGIIGQGEKIWILVKLSDVIKVTSEDTVDQFLLCSNNHDGKGARRIFFAPIRSISQNTLNVALKKNFNQIKSICNVGDVEEKSISLEEILGNSKKYYDDFEVKSGFLVSKQVSSGDIDEYLNNCFHDYEQKAKKVKNMITRVRENFEEEGKMIPSIAGTYWALFNAYIGYIDHQRATKGDNDYDRKSNHLNSIWLGSSVKLKQRGWDVAMKMASK